MKIVYVSIILMIFQILALMSVNQIKRRTATIRQCLLMIDNIEIYLCYENLNTYEIFNKLQRTGLYSELEFINYILANYDTKNESSFLNNQTIQYIDSIKAFDMQDKNNLKGFLSMLGKSDLNGQIMNCKTYKEFFKRKLEIVEKSETSRCKSTYTLVSGIGIISVIVLM